MKYKISNGTPYRLGAFYDGEGTNFAVFSANASQIDLCLFSEDGTKEIDRISMPERTGPVWHGYLHGLKPGTHCMVSVRTAFMHQSRGTVSIPINCY